MDMRPSLLKVAKEGKVASMERQAGKSIQRERNDCPLEKEGGKAKGGSVRRQGIIESVPAYCPCINCPLLLLLLPSCYPFEASSGFGFRFTVALLLLTLAPPMFCPSFSPAKSTSSPRP